MPWSDIDPKTGKKKAVFGTDADISKSSIYQPTRRTGDEKYIGSGFHWPAGDLVAQPASSVSSRMMDPDERRDRAWSQISNQPQGEPGSIGNQSPPMPTPQKSILDIIMERLDQPYQRPDPSKMDFSALDNALKERLGAIGGVRDQAQGNFNTSDANLAAMHNAFENQVRTEDAARYNQIADTEKGNLQGNANQAIGAIEGARAKAVAERQAMLKNLGIEAAGGAVDPSNEIYNRGINTTNERNLTGQNLAESQRGTNLAYNNTVAQSIGQQGLARRAALGQQLQGILGKLGMAESEARAQNQQQRQAAITGADDQAYKQWNDQQNRTQHMFDTLSGQEVAREKIAASGQAAKAPHGLQGIAYDLQSSGMDPALSQRGLAALGSILSEGNYLQDANGAANAINPTPYDRTNVMAQKLKAKDPSLDNTTAMQIAIAYSKLT